MKTEEVDVDANQFESLTRTLAQAPTRRRLLGLLAAGVVSAWRAPAARGAQPGCAPGLTDCGGGCVDLLSDPHNCGACFTPCESGLVAVVCQGGVCVRDDCPPGLTYCGAADLCRDLTADPLHCGGCGNACASGICTGGVCVAPALCEPGFTECGGRCVALANDPFHCGACFNACAGVPLPGQSSVGACADGVCRVVCESGFAECGGRCVDVAADPFHCGACFNACAGEAPAGQSSVGQCLAGVCAIVCEPGYGECGGRCIDVSADPANCGACGNVCARNAGCHGGDCVCDAEFTYCPGTAACFDLDRDPANCGGCGQRCSEDETCREGACVGSDISTPTPIVATISTIGWPFDLDEAGDWTIVNGYRGEGSHAVRSDGSANYFLYALDFARCAPDRVDAAAGVCRLAPGGLLAEGTDRAGWDETATEGATVLSPVDGAIAWVDESDPPCLGVGIAIDDAPGYRLALFHVAGYPTSGSVRRGEPIGSVAAGGCGPGNRIEMVLYEVGEDPADPVAARTGIPFAGEWEIAGCAYPDNKRTINQYRGELVPCVAVDATNLGA
jgi:hypothetical protein